MEQSSPLSLASAGVIFGNLSIALHTQSGDLQLTESASFNSSGDGEFASLMTITGGTRRFTGASGYIFAHGTSTITLVGSPATPFWGTGQSDYIGKVIIP